MIIPLKNQLMQFFSTNFLDRTARRCGFMERIRTIVPHHLVLSLLSAVSKGNCHTIADLHRQFNGMSPQEQLNVAYKPFHNQLRKEGFAKFMKELTRFGMAQFVERISESLPRKLSCFDDVLLQDGSSFAVHHGLAEIFPSRFQKNQAAIECHLLISLLSQSPKAMEITADTAAERTFMPDANTLHNKLLLADAGYVDFDYFEQIDLHGGFFTVRGWKSLNPTIVEARNGQGRRLTKLEGKKLQAVNRKTNRSEVLDLRCKRGNYEFRVVRRWFSEEKRFCLWLTNLPQDTYNADDVMAIYRCRWQIELTFKELKSHTNWQRFATAQKAIVEGLVWASLLALTLRRTIAMRFVRTVSFFRAAKNVDVWLLPILEALIHHAWSEIEPRLLWAKQYLLKNAAKAQQRKSIQNRTLDGIFRALNA